MIQAFGPGDVVIYITLGDEEEIAVPVRQFVSLEDSDGNIDGAFKVGTVLYSTDKENNVFENALGVPVSISVATHRIPVEELFSYPDCVLRQSKLNVPNPTETVTATYYFSNRDDWQKHLVELPIEQPRPIDYRDVLYRLTRAVEALKPDDVENVMTTDEYQMYLAEKQDRRTKYILEEQ